MNEYPRDPLPQLMAVNVRAAGDVLDAMVDGARAATYVKGGDRTRAAVNQAQVLYRDMDGTMLAGCLAVLLQRHVLALDRPGTQ